MIISVQTIEFYGTLKKKKAELYDMRVAICQTNIIWEDKEANFSRAEYWIKEAKNKNADVIFFPEMSFTGFSMNTGLTGETDDFTVDKMREYSKKYDIFTGFGWVKKREDLSENHYTVVDPEGRMIGDYVKIHPFSYSKEDKYFVSGNELITCDIKGIKVGLQICYDLRFPEVFQLLAEQSDMIIVPANWPERRREHWKCLLQARAIECQTYVAGINCCGQQMDLKYSGDSCVFAPDGTKIGGFLESEGLILAEIKKDISEYRGAFPMRKDRKWEWYGQKYQARKNEKVTLFLTSSPWGIYRSDEQISYEGLNPANGFLEEIKKDWKKNARCMIIAADPDAWECNDQMKAAFKERFEKSDLSISEIEVCDHRNYKEVEAEIQSYDVLVFGGGHVPTQNHFLWEMNLPERLKEYDGIVIGVSAGTMNCADTVYAIPEEAGESERRDYCRFIRGLGFTDVMIIPHYQAIKDDILDGKKLIEEIAVSDSKGKEFYLIPDESYVLQRNGIACIRGRGYRLKDGRMEEIK